MATLADRARAMAGRAGLALVRFSTTSPAVPGFEPPGPDRARGAGSGKARAIGTPDALYGRTTYGAGPALTRYSSQTSAGIEPQQIYQLQLLRNQGYPQLWTELVEEVIERDGHLGGVYDTRRHSVADKPFRVHPSRRGDVTAECLSKLCERVVDGIDGFDQSVEDLLSAPAYGYAMSELVWTQARVRVPLPSGGAATLPLRVPRTLEWVHWKHVRFDRHTDEPYLWAGSDGEVSLPENKFVFHASAGTGLIERRGFMGSCVWLSAAKRWSERDWLVYAKIFGIPQILAQYPDGKEEYELHRDRYVQFLKDWGEGIPALLPDDFNVTVSREAAGRSGDIFGAIIGWANSEISKRILGSTLTVEIGNQGAYAAADTHRDAPYMRSRADARKLASTLRRDLLKPVIALNATALANAYGVTPEELLGSVPKCSWRIEREMSPTDRQRVYEGAVNELGLEVDEEQYRDEMGLDAPRPGGKALAGKPQQVSSGGALVGSVEASQQGAQAPKEPSRSALGAEEP